MSCDVLQAPLRKTSSAQSTGTKQFKFKSISLRDGEDSSFSVSGSIQGKDYPDFIGEPLTKGIVVPCLLRNSITEVDQYLANVKFCFATFGLHPSRAVGSVPFLCSGPWSRQRNPGDDSFWELKFLFEVASRCLNSGIGNGSDFQLVVGQWTRGPFTDTPINRGVTLTLHGCLH